VKNKSDERFERFRAVTTRTRRRSIVDARARRARIGDER
jgi:hypothetical protein